MRTILVLLAVLAAPASAQGLQIHAAVTSDAPGDTTGMRRQSVASAPGGLTWVGPAVLRLPPGSIQTVGLETSPDGNATLSVWLTAEAGDAFATLTEASVGRALAVVWDERVLAVPVVRSAIPNGLVVITGLDASEAERLAATLREATDVEVPETRERETRAAGAQARVARSPASAGQAPPVRPLGVPARPPLRVDPPPPADGRAAGVPAAEEFSRTPTAPASGSVLVGASAAALSFSRAVARRDWPAVADALHPDALRAARPSAQALLRLENGTVYADDGAQQASVSTVNVLGSRTLPGRIEDLSDRDLATVYLAALDALGTWGSVAAPQSVVGEVRDGDRVHVLLRASGDVPGLSEIAVVTLAPDAAGRWRPLLTQPQGF